MIRPAAGFCLPTLLLVGACGSGADNLEQANQNGPVRVASDIVEAGQAALPGTPMAQRVAIVGLLNKRNGITRDLTMKPGEALRAGDAIVRLRACEKTAPWENPPETGAFVQLDVLESRDKKWHRIFSGWLFKDRPERNVVQHPIYDVWVKSCAMSWPEVGPDTVGSIGGGNASASSPSSASNAPAGNATEPAAPAATVSPPVIPKPAPKPTPSTAAPSNPR